VPGFTKKERAHAHGGEDLGGKLPVGGSGGGAEEIRWGGAKGGCGSVRVGPTKRDLGVGKQMTDGAHGYRCPTGRPGTARGPLGPDRAGPLRAAPGHGPHRAVPTPCSGHALGP
jgi:hypothetical protein